MTRSYRGNPKGIGAGRRIQGAGLRRGVGGGCGPSAPPPGSCGVGPQGQHQGHAHGHHHGHHHHHEHVVHHCGCEAPAPAPNGNGGGIQDPTGGWITDRPNGGDDNGNGGGIPGGGIMGANAAAGIGWYSHPNAGRLTFKQRKFNKMVGKQKRPLTLGAKQAYRRNQGWYY